MLTGADVPVDLGGIPDRVNLLGSPNRFGTVVGSTMIDIRHRRRLTQPREAHPADHAVVVPCALSPPPRSHHRVPAEHATTR